MIGDGMGFNHLKAANVKNPFVDFPYHGEVTHCSLSGITDSAAAATTMATGEKTLNGHLGLDAQGKPLTTILERAKKQKWATGLVTTTEITHATPAGFAAHVRDRENAMGVAHDYLEKTQPDLLLGGGRKFFTELGLPAELGRGILWRGYWVFNDLRDAKRSPARRLGLFAPSHMTWEMERRKTSEPSLGAMTESALDYLGQRQPFFLMIEGGRIDHGAHENNVEHMKPEVVEFARAAAQVFKWAKKQQRVLLLVTADHETGGLNERDATFVFSTDKHTDRPVPIFGYGEYASVLEPTQDNRAVYWIMRHALDGQ